MNKNSFNNILYENLKNYLPYEDIQRTLNFFNEIINDKIEEGIPEEEAIRQLGSISSIVDQILEENNINNRKTKLVWRFKPNGVVSIIILVFTFPLWIAFPIILFSLAIAFVSVLLALLITPISLFYWAVKVICFNIFNTYNLTTAEFIFSIGGAFVTLGLSILMTILIAKFISCCFNNKWKFKATLTKIFKKEVSVYE